MTDDALAQRAARLGHRFVAPLARPVRHLHIAEDEAVIDDPDIVSMTMCGLLMLEHELWVEIIRHQGDRLCYACADEAGLIETVRLPETFSIFPKH